MKSVVAPQSTNVNAGVPIEVGKDRTTKLVWVGDEIKLKLLFKLLIA